MAIASPFDSEDPEVSRGRLHDTDFSTASTGGFGRCCQAAPDLMTVAKAAGGREDNVTEGDGAPKNIDSS
jgi:hypothetical protein